MAKRTKARRWSYKTGEKGRNRVRVFEHEAGVIMLEYKSEGRRTRRSLGHRDREQAKRTADKVAASFRAAEVASPTSESLTIRRLFDIYLREVTPAKAASTQKHDQRTLQMFARFFGPERRVNTLSRIDHDRFIRERRAGRIRPGEGRNAKGVGDRVIEQNLRLLYAVFRWGRSAGDGRGGTLVPRSPFDGCRPPREKNPVRVVLTTAEYTALLRVADVVGWRFRVALVLAHETGHRIGAITQLRWGDVDLKGGVITWRAENEKTGFEHSTPMTPAAAAAFERARAHSPGIGDAPVLPSPKDPTRGLSRHLARDYWKRAERLAALPTRRGRGWHALRRKFASELMHVPLKTLCQLGGWKSPQTVLTCYQHPDQDQLRDALGRRQTAVEGA